MNALIIRALTLDWRREEGQTMAEYAVVLAVIVIATVAIFVTLGGAITTKVQSVIDVLSPGP